MPPILGENPDKNKKNQIPTSLDKNPISKRVIAFMAENVAGFIKKIVSVEHPSNSRPSQPIQCGNNMEYIPPVSYSEKPTTINTRSGDISNIPARQRKYGGKMLSLTNISRGIH